MKECMGLAKVFQDQENKRRDDRDNDGKDHENHNAGGAFQDPSKTVHTIFGGLAASKNKRDKKLTSRRVLVVRGIDTIADPRYIPW